MQEFGIRGNHNGRIKWGRKGKFILIFLLAGLLCSCKGAGMEEKAGSGESPEDEPWNHGSYAIMETEAGYYSTLENVSLRYYDKATGVSMLLCDKPQCQHQGDDACEATYKKIQVVNACLYEGEIILEGVEKEQSTVSLNLYRAALDGSRIDKIGCVISAENLKEEEVFSKQPDMFDFVFREPDYSFILHKGYAYVPYYLRFGKGSIGLKGGGLARIDLKTGEKEEIYAIEYLSQGVPADLMAQGDYVYMKFFGNYKGSTIKRYVISERRLEDFYGRLPGEEDSSLNLQAPVLLGDRVYDLNYVYESDESGFWPKSIRFVAYDAGTGEYLEEESFDTGVDYQFPSKAAFAYEDKLFFADLYCGYWFDKQGNQLARIPFPEDLTGVKPDHAAGSNGELEALYKVHDGKLYLIFWDRSDLRYHALVNGNVGYRKRVFSCDLENVFQGNGEWTELFTIEGITERKEKEW